MGIIDSFTKGIANNPIVGAALVVGIPLFLFRDKIGAFFNPVGEFAEDVSQGFSDAVDSTGQFFGDIGEQASNLFSGLPEAVADTGESLQSGLAETSGIQQGVSNDVDAAFSGIGDFFGSIFKGITDSINSVVPQAEAEIQGPIDARIEDRPLNLNEFVPQMDLSENNQIVQSEIDNQQFLGGGPSFDGGVIRETPIEFLSLSKIIDRFGVSASQAADIRARAQDDFDDFDFGTNTGFGIGSVSEDIPELQNVDNVSDSQFENLTAQEIALRLTGGNISNF